MECVTRKVTSQMSAMGETDKKGAISMYMRIRRSKGGGVMIEDGGEGLDR